MKSLRSTIYQDGISPDGERSRKLIQEQFGIFAESVLARLDQGATTYGDSSLDRPIQELIAEAQQEAEDIPGWGFLVWCKMRHLKELVAEIERRIQ